MSAVAIQDNSVLPQEPIAPTLPEQAVNTVINTSLGMAFNYAFVTTLLTPFQYFGYCENATRVTHSTLAALSAPVRPLASYCFKTILGCDENTKWKNMTENMATMVTTSVIAGLACNYLGYNIDTRSLVYQNLQMVVLGVIPQVLQFAIEELIPLDEEMDDLDLEDPSIDPARVKQFKENAALKTERVKQLWLDEI